MVKGLVRTLRIGFAAFLLFFAADVQAQYDYGGGTEYGGETGVLLILEGMLANPRNTDNDFIATWDDELAGRIGLGYQWRNGNRLLGSVWSYDTAQSTSGVVEVQITARTGDVAFGKLHQPAERFVVDWSVGLRFASYEEQNTVQGSMESEMLGARAALRGAYRFGSFSVTSGLGFSFLDGETTTTVGGQSSKDDSRSGTITDFDVAIAWHNRRDSIRVLLGWEQSVWEDLVVDPAGVLTTSARDNVTFSGPKLGVSFVF
jgi:hypothetical protein